MRHHLIALFALLSGLAALQAPAHAAAPQAAVHDARNAARAHEIGAHQTCAIIAQTEQRTSLLVAKVLPPRVLVFDNALGAPVCIGSDRALE